MLKGLSNLGSIIKQAQQLGGQMQGLGEKLKERRASGAAGGGLVEVEINGLLEILECKIDPSLVDGGDREMIEDLVAAAVNQAIVKGKQLHAEAMQEMTSGMQLPGLQEMMEKMNAPQAPDTPDKPEEPS